MIKIITRILIIAFAILLIAQYVPGFEVSNFYSALIVALLLGVISVTLKPLILILTLPINLLTLGLFTFVINVLLLWWVASFVDGFSVGGFIPAFVGALIIGAVNSIIHRIF